MPHKKGGKEEPSEPKSSPHLERLSLGPKSSGPQEQVLDGFTAKRNKIKKQLDEMVAHLEKDCYRIIFDVFPEKIQLFDDMYKNRKEFNLSKGEVVQDIQFDEPQGPYDEDFKRKLNRIQIPPNKALSDLVEILQKELLEMSEMINTLGIWVKMNVPRIADGNNFGVEVQEEITTVFDQAEASGYEILDGFAGYHLGRAEIVAKIIKFPGIQDYRLALQELDEKSYIKTSLLACDLRNDYLTLYDLLSKNLDTLTKPRGSEDEKIARMY